jgi:hypothetical protein
VDEGVLVADDVPRRPPHPDVGVIRLRDHDLAKALTLRRVVGEVHLELVHPLQVEDDAPVRAVDLEGVVVLASRCEACGLEGPHGPVLEAREKGRGVVHGHRSRAVATGLQRALPDERLGGPYYLLYGSNEEVRQVDEVGAQVS